MEGGPEKDDDGAEPLPPLDPNDPGSYARSAQELVVRCIGAIEAIERHLARLTDGRENGGKALPAPAATRHVTQPDAVRNKRALAFSGHKPHDIVYAEDFARVVREMNVKVVVLTTCRGSVRGASRWRGLAAALLRAGVPVVVGMQYAIKEAAAIAFSHGFYEALADGKSVDQAVSEGRMKLAEASDEALDEGGPGDRLPDDFGLPVLYSRMTRTEDLGLPNISSAAGGRPQREMAER